MKTKFGLLSVSSVLIVLVVASGYAYAGVSARKQSPASLQLAIVYPPNGILTPGQSQVVQVVAAIQPSPGTKVSTYRLMLKVQGQNGRTLVSNSFNPTQSDSLATINMKKLSPGDYALTAQLQHNGTIVTASQQYNIRKAANSVTPTPTATATVSRTSTPTAAIGTATPTATATATPTAAATRTSMPTATFTATATQTPTASSTRTAIGTATPTINCPSGFVGATGGACSTGGAGQAIYLPGGISSDPAIVLLNDTVHQGGNAFYETPVNIQAFTTTFTFHDSCATQPGNCGNGFGFCILAANSQQLPFIRPDIAVNVRVRMMRFNQADVIEQKLVAAGRCPVGPF